MFIVSPLFVSSLVSRSQLSFQMLKGNHPNGLRWWGIPGIPVVVLWDHKATYPIAKPNMDTPMFEDRDFRLVTPCYAYIIYWYILEIKAGDMWSLQLLGCSLRHRFEAPLETWRTAGLSMFSRVFIFQVLQGLVDLSVKFFYHLVI